EITVDVERLTVEVPAAGITHTFPMEPQTQHRFLNGLDDVGITMTHADDITSYEKTRPAWLG
ncbi:MAG: 3-isopropylmalate dehydratase small subunit, partial [Ilumatobacteraceae bacterium]